MEEPLLNIVDLRAGFETERGFLPAVDGVSLNVKRGEIVGVVGESGCGKSATAMSVMQLLPDPPGKVESGEIWYEGRDLLKLKRGEINRTRGSEIAMIFQEPMTSLNPTLTCGFQIAESLRYHQRLSRKEAKAAAVELLRHVGIPLPERRVHEYPHQLSGGMRQRVMIALALACRPKLLIADEPTTALDVTIQAQILALFKDIQKQADTSIIFITHDLGVVANVADRVAVVYGGKIVETGLAEEIFYHPQHPYTWGLLRSMPALDTEDEELYAIPGSPPNLLDPPPGDAFAARNPYALTADVHAEPPMFQISPTHFAATWLLDPRAPRAAVPDAIAARHRYYRSRKQGSAQNAE